MLICAGCGIKVQEVEAATPTLEIITATLPLTQTLSPSQTPLPPPPSPTLVPVSGTATTTINVRSAPSTANETIGIIPANTVVQIIGKDPGENWWQILYPQAEGGKGWVAAQFVTTAGKSEVPVIGGDGSDSKNGYWATIQQQINIRNGPGTSFNSIGTLNPQDVVSLTGKDANGTWFQIEFSSGPEGKGWINAAFVQAQGIENIPIITESGQVLGTGTPESTLPPPTATVVPAPMDNDSADQPIARVTLEPSGTHLLIYSGDVSAPNGDTQDWIEFQTYTTSVALEIECRGNATISASVSTTRQVIRENITCGQQVHLSTTPGNAYLVNIRATSANSNLQYTSYTLSLNLSP